jgi:gliding motility-associated-like protein
MDSVMVQLISGNDFCQDTDKVAVPIVKPHLFIPNFFMPEDHDPGLNTFRVTTTAHIRSYQIAIFDRAGRRVFHADTPNTPWDGTHDGTPCPQAAYVYRISYTTSLIPNSPQCVTGTVVLCR